MSTAACNVQTIGRDVLYTPRVETRLKTGKRNKVAIGALFSKLGEDYSHPFKVTAWPLVCACRHAVVTVCVLFSCVAAPWAYRALLL